MGISLIRRGYDRSYSAPGGCGSSHAFDGMTLAQIVEAVRLLRMLGDRTLLDIYNRAEAAACKGSTRLGGKVDEKIELLAVASEVKVGDAPAGPRKHRRQH